MGKTLLKVISSLFVVPLTFHAYAAQGDESNTLRLYNWADYIGEKTIADFEKATGIKVVYDTFDSYETVQAKLLTGHSGYDLIVLNASLAPPLIKAKVFQPLDKKQLPGWTNLDPQILEDRRVITPAPSTRRPTPGAATA